jgi:hypothetical protein
MRGNYTLAGPLFHSVRSWRSFHDERLPATATQNKRTCIPLYQDPLVHLLHHAVAYNLDMINKGRFRYPRISQIISTWNSASQIIVRLAGLRPRQNASLLTNPSSPRRFSPTIILTCEKYFSTMINDCELWIVDWGFSGFFPA